MRTSSAESDRRKIWDLIKHAHSALLVTVAADGSLDSRPMGCLQREFDGTLWFLTFLHSEKMSQIRNDDQVLVSYARTSAFEYVSISGRARIVEDRQKIKELWSEDLHVWFPKGPDDPELALIAIEAETAKYWTDAASVLTYAWAYVKARTTGQSPSAGDIATIGKVKF